MKPISELLSVFEACFHNPNPPKFFFAPARVNLIGEHIDYHGGDVMPAALDMGTLIIAAENGTDTLRLCAEDLPGISVACPLDKLNFFRGKGWGSYQLGVAAFLSERGETLRGMDMLFCGDIPFGAGLSSSASIEVATAVALTGQKGSPSLAVLCQRVENEFVGLNCGIMDQYASACGKKDHAMLLNCDTLSCSYVPLDLKDACLVITNTNKKRGLADSKYNERRGESEEALARLKAVYPGRTYLCQFTEEELKESIGLFADAPILFDRALHVVTEQARVHKAAECMKNGDLVGFGELLHASNLSLRDKYEVTGEHLDALYDAICAVEGVYGTRMTGAGFGGCNVSLVKKDAVETFKTEVSARYEKQTGIVPSFYLSGIGEGARELSKEELV